MYPCGTIYRDIEQGTEEWHALRLGKVTASKVKDVLATVKNGEAAAIRNYRAQLVAERLTGQREETYKNAAMQRGNDMEATARMCYEFVTGNTVEQVAFVDHPSIEWAGMSPDGIIGSGLVEIKCPNTATHIDYLLANVMPAEYIPQVQFQMACCGAGYCDFVSFDDRLPEDLQLFIIRVERDNDYIAIMEEKVKAFLQSVDSMVEALKARKG